MTVKPACRFDMETPDGQEKPEIVEEENKEEALKPDDMEFVAPGD